MSADLDMHVNARETAIIAIGAAGLSSSGTNACLHMTPCAMAYPRFNAAMFFSRVGDSVSVGWVGSYEFSKNRKRMSEFYHVRTI